MAGIPSQHEQHGGLNPQHAETQRCEETQELFAMDVKIIARLTESECVLLGVSHCISELREFSECRQMLINSIPLASDAWEHSSIVG